VKRREDPRLVTGAGRFTDDVHPAGCLHAVFVRSTLAHASGPTSVSFCSSISSAVATCLISTPWCDAWLAVVTSVTRAPRSAAAAAIANPILPLE